MNTFNPSKRYRVSFDCGKVRSSAWPGGYPVFYIADDGEALCPSCVHDNFDQCDDDDFPTSGWFVVGEDINWEDASLYCVHCNKRIESAYAEDEAI